MFLVLCITALSMTLVQAQERTYSGVVKGSDGQPIIGASVEVVGTTVGTSTGLDGDYTIKANQGSKIKYSFLGTKSVTVTAGGSTTINVTLEDDATALDEVVVQAFGTVKKKDLTGSISTIDSKLISSQANSTLSKALEGAIPGIQVSSVDGQPGLDMGIRIRGIGSASQSNANALIVVDGVPYNNTYGYGKNVLSTINPKDVESITVLKDAASTALWGSRGANGVIMVTTKKGQQGKAKITFEGKWGINMIGNNQPKLVRGVEDQYEMMWESIYNSVRYGSKDLYTTNYSNPNMSHEEAALFASQHLFNYTGSTTAFTGRNTLYNWMYYDVPGAKYVSTGTGNNRSATMEGAYLIDPATGRINPNAKKLWDVDDWRDIAYKNRFRQEYTVTASGATDKTDYYISAGYMSDPAYIANSHFNRYNVRSNINTQVTKWLKAGLNMSYSRRSTQQQNGRWSSRNPGAMVQNVFTWVNMYNPMASIYQRDENGNLMYDTNGDKIVVSYLDQQYSPVGVVAPKYPSATKTVGYDLQYQMDNSKSEFIQNDFSTIGYLEAKFLKDFTFNARASVDQTYGMRYIYLPKKYGESAGTEQGMMGRNYSDNYTINAQQTLTWAHDYGKHHVDAIIGHEFDWSKYQSLNYKSSLSLIDGFDTFANFIYLNNGGTFSGVGGGEDREALEGYFMRANYVFDNKYYVTGSVRTDGSSKFKEMDKRWGVFWSVGGAWRISAENWMQSASSWLTDLKIRADYGVIGNQSGIGRYSGYQTWSYGATGYTTPGSYAPKGWKLTQNAAPNTALTWEKRKTVDAGLDFRLWDRFYGTLDWYQTNTTDMLLDAPISYAMSGQTSLLQNVGELRTRGFEFDLGVDIIKTPDILWSFGVNGAHYKVKMMKAPESMINQEDALHSQKWWYATADAWNAVGNTGSGSSAAYRRWIGGDYYNVISAKYMGVDKTTGLPLFGALVTKDNQNKFPDAKVGEVVATTDYSEAYMFDQGDATPDLMGGFSTSFRWKDLDFSAQFAFQIGGKFFSNLYGNFLYDSGNLGARIMSADLLGNTFNAENTNAKFPMLMKYPANGSTTYLGGIRVGTGNTYSDLAMFDASYLSVKNITVGYNFPQKWMDKIGIGGIRVYASLDNMWLICRNGIDPRNSIVGGFDVGGFTYPMMRSCSLGVNVTF